MPAGEIHLLAGFEKILAGFSPRYSPLQHSLNCKKQEKAVIQLCISSQRTRFYVALALTCVSRTVTGDLEGMGGLCRLGIFGSCSETVWQGELFTYHLLFN